MRALLTCKYVAWRRSGSISKIDSGVMLSKCTGNVANKGRGIEYKNYKAVEHTGTMVEQMYDVVMKDYKAVD